MTIKALLKALRDKCPQANFRITGSVGCTEADFYFPRNELLGDPNQSVYIIGADGPHGYVSWSVSQYSIDNYPLVVIVALTGYIKGEPHGGLISKAKFEGLFV